MADGWTYTASAMHIEKFRFARSSRFSLLHLTFRSVVLAPARAYVLSSSLNPENLARAETALNELLDSIPPGDVSVHHTPPLLLSPDDALA
jgi:hypothetical protein